ncbi:MAG: hypothetical protein N4A50_05105 [Vallitalea sp.]|jgi:hypothetical protein|nr:hypothetical protein [Vallitalea sp.]
MSSDGEKTNKPQIFVMGKETKVSLSGVVTLSNENSKIKLEVPGIMPSRLGMKQLEVNQVNAHSSFINKLKSAK